jgi:hypothetical protein
LSVYRRNSGSDCNSSNGGSQLRDDIAARNRFVLGTHIGITPAQSVRTAAGRLSVPVCNYMERISQQSVASRDEAASLTNTNIKVDNKVGLSGHLA